MSLQPSSIMFSLPCGSDDKESACHAGDPGLNPGLERSPGEGNGYPLQYSCLENPMDRGAWWAIQSMGSQWVGHDWATNTHTLSHHHSSITGNKKLTRELRPPFPAPTRQKISCSPLMITSFSYPTLTFFSCYLILAGEKNQLLWYYIPFYFGFLLVVLLSPERPGVFLFLW